MQTTKIQSFTDLIVWQKGHTFVLNIYKETKNFPRGEIYSLIDQMRRSAVSITSNIAEGFGRQGRKEKIQFYYTALASCTELQNQLLAARDVGYLPNEKFGILATESLEITKMLNGLIRKIKNG